MFHFLTFYRGFLITNLVRAHFNLAPVSFYKYTYRTINNQYNFVRSMAIQSDTFFYVIFALILVCIASYLLKCVLKIRRKFSSSHNERTIHVKATNGKETHIHDDPNRHADQAVNDINNAMSEVRLQPFPKEEVLEAMSVIQKGQLTLKVEMSDLAKSFRYLVDKNKLKLDIESLKKEWAKAFLNRAASCGETSLHVRGSALTLFNHIVQSYRTTKVEMSAEEVLVQLLWRMKKCSAENKQELTCSEFVRVTEMMVRKETEGTCFELEIIFPRFRTKSTMRLNLRDLPRPSFKFLMDLVQYRFSLEYGIELLKQLLCK